MEFESEVVAHALAGLTMVCSGGVAGFSRKGSTTHPYAGRLFAASAALTAVLDKFDFTACAPFAAIECLNMLVVNERRSYSYQQVSGLLPVALRCPVLLRLIEAQLVSCSCLPFVTATAVKLQVWAVSVELSV